MLLSVFMAVLLNGCSATDESSSADFSKNESQIIFVKSPEFEWKNKKVEVSFEDEFKKFLAIDVVSKKGAPLRQLLSENNLQQGVTVKLKVSNSLVNFQKVNEIMIESYDLHKGINQFTIGYNDNKPYIIY